MLGSLRGNCKYYRKLHLHRQELYPKIGLPRSGLSASSSAIASPSQSNAKWSAIVNGIAVTAKLGGLVATMWRGRSTYTEHDWYLSCWHHAQ
jgi:hypothetical protein